MSTTYTSKVIYGCYVDQLSKELQEQVENAIYYEEVQSATSCGLTFVGVEVTLSGVEPMVALQRILQAVSDAESNPMLKAIQESGVKLVVNCCLDSY